MANADTAALFGVDAKTAARIEQVVELAGELKATATRLDEQTRTLCMTLASDLDPTPVPTGVHPCTAAVQRFEAFSRKLPAGGKLEVNVRGVTCGVPRRALEQCAGECLTGKPGVTSAVSCGAAPDQPCRLEASFPNASPTCATRCSTRALVLSACSADLDVRISTTAEGLAPTVDALRRDLPKLVALGGELAPKAVRASKQAAQLVDDLAGTIDSVTSSGNKSERRVVAFAALASCIAPELAETVRAGTQLQTSVDAAVSLHRTVIGR